MKLRITTAMACVCLFAASCTDVSLLSYGMNFATVAMTIDATDNPDTTYSLVSDPINPKEEMDKNGVSADLIKEVSIDEVIIELLSPETGNFDWAKSASVIISAVGQPDTPLGELLDVPMGINVLSIVTTGADLTEYLKGGAFTIKLDASNDMIIPVDHQVKVKTVFTVKI